MYYYSTFENCCCEQQTKLFFTLPSERLNLTSNLGSFFDRADMHNGFCSCKTGSDVRLADEDMQTTGTFHLS